MQNCTPSALTDRLKSLTKGLPGYDRYIMLTYASESFHRHIYAPRFTCKIQLFFAGGEVLEYESDRATMDQAVTEAFQEIEGKLIKRTFQTMQAAKMQQSHLVKAA